MSTHAQMWIDRTRNALAFSLIGAFIGAIVALHFRAIPSTNKDLLTYMLGQLSGMALMALGYYFTKGAGQDVLDASRTANTAKSLDTIKAIADAKGSEKPAVEIEEAVDQVAGAATDKADQIKGEPT